MFKGTLKPNTYFATLQLVEKLAKLAKEKTILELQNTTFSSLFTKKEMKKYWETLGTRRATR